MCDEPRALMIFAAGLGTRMGALTAHRPKPMIEVAGRPLIDHALAQADGAAPVVVNLHYLPDQIRDHLAGRPNVRFSDESDRVLETGGGLRRALPLLGGGPVFTLNSDAVWTGPAAMAQLRRAWQPERMDALLLLIPRERAAGHTGAGDFLIGDDGQLTRGPGLVYSGAQILRTEGLMNIKDEVFSLNRLWDEMARAGRLFGVVHSGGWCDVGRPESIPLAEDMLRAAHVPGD